MGKKLNWNLVKDQIKMTKQKGKNDQQVVPENSEGLGQTKPISEDRSDNEGESEPELASQVIKDLS